MSRTVVVELICKPEECVVAEVETLGALDALTIRRNAKVLDRLRFPPARVIMDGVQMTCARCHDPLYFRDAEGNEFAAMPGSVEATS